MNYFARLRYMRAAWQARFGHRDIKPENVIEKAPDTVPAPAPEAVADEVRVTVSVEDAPSKALILGYDPGHG